MTALLNLTANARIGRLALAAAALIIGIVAFGAPAAAEAAGGAPIAAAGASENFIVHLLALMFGLIVAGATTAGDAIAGIARLAGL